MQKSKIINICKIILNVFYEHNNYKKFKYHNEFVKYNYSSRIRLTEFKIYLFDKHVLSNHIINKYTHIFSINNFNYSYINKINMINISDIDYENITTELYRLDQYNHNFKDGIKIFLHYKLISNKIIFNPIIYKPKIKIRQLMPIKNILNDIEHVKVLDIIKCITPIKYINNDFTFNNIINEEINEITNDDIDFNLIDSL